MNWIAQVLHVFRKDVRQLWRNFAAFYLLIGVGLYRSFRMPEVELIATTTLDTVDSEIIAFVLSLFAIITGIVAVATAVQNDSPVKVKEFWRTRPLAPGAVLSAKLLVAVVAVIVFLLATIGTVFQALHSSPEATLRTLLNVGVSLGFCTLAVVVAGSVTRDVRSAFLILIVSCVVVLFTLSIADRNIFGAPYAVQATFAVAAVAFAMLILVVLYWRNRSSGLSLAVGLPAIAFLMGSTLLNVVPVQTRAAEPNAVPPVSLRFEAQDSTNWESIFGMKFRLATETVPESVRIDVAIDSGKIWRIDSASFSITPPSTGAKVWVAKPRGAMPWLGRKVTWLNADAAEFQGRMLQSNDSRRVPTGAGDKASARAEIFGDVTLSRANVLEYLPLKHNAMTFDDGRRFRIARLRESELPAGITVELTALPRGAIRTNSYALNFFGGPLFFSLVNAERGEAIVLFPASSSNTSESLVIPTLTVSKSLYELTAKSKGFESRLPVDKGWYTNAQLVAMEWVPMTTYPVKVEGRVK